LGAKVDAVPWHNLALLIRNFDRFLHHQQIHLNRQEIMAPDGKRK
jgi:hypothetical protein